MNRWDWQRQQAPPPRLTHPGAHQAMTGPQLGRLWLPDLIAAYLNTRPGAWHDRTLQAHAYVPAMSRERLVNAILDQRPLPKRRRR